jgi:hypothetical protein
MWRSPGTCNLADRSGLAPGLQCLEGMLHWALAYLRRHRGIELLLQALFEGWDIDVFRKCRLILCCRSLPHVMHGIGWREVELGWSFGRLDCHRFERVNTVYWGWLFR